jgi:hypothetical protein
MRPPRVEPRDDEIDVVQRCAASVSAAGVLLPEFNFRFFDVVAFDAPETAPRGITHYQNPLEVSLQTGMSRRELVRTVFHELRHVADSHLRTTLTKDELEARAERFSEMMLRRFVGRGERRA